MIGAPRQLLEFDAAQLAEDVNRLCNDLRADAVARDDSNLARDQGSTLLLLIIKKVLCIISAERWYPLPSCKTLLNRTFSLKGFGVLDFNTTSIWIIRIP